MIIIDQKVTNQYSKIKQNSVPDEALPVVLRIVVVTYFWEKLWRMEFKATTIFISKINKTVK